MEGYGYDNVNINPTQIFSANNWTLKKNQDKGPLFIAHMLSICKAIDLVAFQALNSSAYLKKEVFQGKKPGAKSGHKKQSTSSKQPSVSKSEATKVSTPMDLGMHKEDQQATGDPTSLGVTSEDGANPQISSAMSTFTHLKPIYSASVIIHSESASGCDSLADSTTEVDPRKYAPNDSLPL
ncbi:hypothetical protein Tco_1457870 [Tanacetum coccineum]